MLAELKELRGQNFDMYAELKSLREDNTLTSTTISNISKQKSKYGAPRTKDCVLAYSSSVNRLKELIPHPITKEFLDNLRHAWMFNMCRWTVAMVQHPIQTINKYFDRWDAAARH